MVVDGLAGDDEAFCDLLVRMSPRQEAENLYLPGRETSRPVAAALVLVTGAYTVYGGLTAVAWTSSLQCVLLLGGGIYVFFAGMAKIGFT